MAQDKDVHGEGDDAARRSPKEQEELDRKAAEKAKEAELERVRRESAAKRAE
jgi:hypothetical protein